MSKRLTTEEFTVNAKKIHSKYDYSKVEYTNMLTKVCIICPEHGEFYQKPHDHLNGFGCWKCGIAKRRKTKSLTTKQFVEKSKIVHGDKYDYSKVDYRDYKTKVCIICPEHGEFWQRPSGHLHGDGCPKCGGSLKRTIDSFVKDANLKHNNKYDYEKVVYKNNLTKVEIICPFHGSFWQLPKNHLNGQGCPYCNTSQGEKEICKILTNLKINFTTQKKFDWLTFKKKQSLDIYLPDYKVAIEYQGEQHFESKHYFGGDEGFNKIVERDNNKFQLCLNNGVKIEYINYKDSIQDALNNILKKYNIK